ncbi:WD40 repeat domain-containing protein [Bacteroides caecigallinarum]|nr:WD40 repeat domain-containing protein [Bacteroides caecigallinarum]
MNEIKNYWLGLNSYSENDILYGRDKETVELSEIVLSSVSSIMFGRSGIGKSSLLRAKIFPMLRYNDFFPVYVRLEHNGSIGYAKQIGNCIKDTVQTWNGNKSCLKVDVKFDEMTDNVCELVRSVEFVEIDTSIRKILVLVFDQFEEIFTITDYSHKEEVDRFFSQTASLLNNFSRDNFRLLLCIREDYIYYLEHVSATIPMLKRNRYQLKAFSYGQARQVICSPDPNLVTKEITDAIIYRLDAGENGEIDPAILSLFMHELFEKGNGKITQENLNLFGDNIIMEFYEEGKKLISEHSVKFLEDRLVTSDGFRCNLSYNDALIYGITNDELEILKNKRIITVEKIGKNQLYIELSHDILCPVVLKSRQERRHKEETEKYIALAKALKKRQLVIASFSVLAMFLVCLFAYLFFEIKEQKNGMLANQSRFVAKEAMELAQKGEFVKAMALLTEVYPHNVDSPERPLVREAYDALRVLRDSTRLLKIMMTDDEYLDVYRKGNLLGTPIVVFSPNNRYIVTTKVDSIARIWDVESGKCLTVFKHLDIIDNMEFSPDGRYLLTNSNCVSQVWDVESGKCLKILNETNGALFSPDGRCIVALTNKRLFRIWDIETGKCQRSFEEKKGSVESFKFSPDGKYIITALFNNNEWDTINIWDYELCKLKRSITCFGFVDISDVEFNSNGNFIAAISYSRIGIWNFKTGECIGIIEDFDDYFVNLIFMHNADHIVTHGYKGDRIWNLKTGNCERIYKYSSILFAPEGNIIFVNKGHDIIIEDAISGECLNVLKHGCPNVICESVSNDGRYLATISDDYMIRVWDISLEREINVINVINDNLVLSAEFSSNGRYIMTTSSDGKSQIWDVKSGECLKVINCGNFRLARFNTDGSRVLTIKDNFNKIFIWDFQTNECLRTIEAENDLIISAFWGDDNKKIVAYCSSSVQIFDVETGQNVKTYLEKDSDSGLALMNSNNRIIRLCSNNNIHLIDVESNECIGILEGVKGSVQSSIFSPNNKYILLSLHHEGRNYVGLWNVKTGKCIGMLDVIYRVADSSQVFSPDSKYFVTSKMNQSACVWDVETLECLCEFKGHKGELGTALFSPDGRSVITSSADGTVRIWNIPDYQELIDEMLLKINGIKFSPKDRREYYLE